MDNGTKGLILATSVILLNVSRELLNYSAKIGKYRILREKTDKMGRDMSEKEEMSDEDIEQFNKLEAKLKKMYGEINRSRGMIDSAVLSASIIGLGTIAVYLLDEDNR